MCKRAIACACVRVRACVPVRVWSQMGNEAQRQTEARLPHHCPYSLSRARAVSVSLSYAHTPGLRAVSKDIHHRRLWGVPPGTSFGVFDPWVNPYYKQPLRMRRVTPEERAAVQGRGWTHAVDIDAL